MPQSIDKLKKNAQDLSLQQSDESKNSFLISHFENPGQNYVMSPPSAFDPNSFYLNLLKNENKLRESTSDGASTLANALHPPNISAGFKPNNYLDPYSFLRLVEWYQKCAKI
jgi:hypothetical protein